jgi:sterol desaturase/sphingolipid hydroxylase (fatty acid hydroxylase superfamily)
MDSQQDKEQTRLFKNPILEAMTHTHIAYPLIIFYGLAVGLMAYTFYEGVLAATSSVLLFVGGFLIFTLVEYLVHRYTYHMPTPTPKRERMQYVMHGVHHDFPRDKTRLALPPLLGIALATLFFLFYRLLLGTYGIPFTAGFVAGYASYLCVHYSVHAFPPPRNFLRILWIHHALHHYQQNDAAFGVSSPLWDVIFGTMPEKKNNSIRTKAGYIDDHNP